jgi:hypothetical protein
MAERLPIIVFIGPSSPLKVQLAGKIATDLLPLRYAVFSDPGTDLFGPTFSDRIELAGCMCCIGAMTLMAQLTTLLRRERRENKYAGLLLIAGAKADAAQLIDQLRQPLLIDLVEVINVIYVTQTLIEEQSLVITSADTIFTSTNRLVSKSESRWLSRLAGSDERRIVSDRLGLTRRAEALLPSDFKRTWPAETCFDRQQLSAFFHRHEALSIAFDGVFHTQRAWYRWHGINATMEETGYRRQSYFQVDPSIVSKSVFQTLSSQIES